MVKRLLYLVLCNECLCTSFNAGAYRPRLNPESCRRAGVGYRSYTYSAYSIAKDFLAAIVNPLYFGVWGAENPLSNGAPYADIDGIGA